jgi:MFS family permease
LAAAGAVAAGGLPDLTPVASGPVTGGIWRRAWPAMVQEGVVLLLVGTAFSALPALLGSVGASADLAGLALAGFAAAGMVGGLIYGARSWPVSYRTQVILLVLALGLAIGAVALAPSVPVIVALIVAAGLAGTPALTARAAALQELLPESRWAAGFSALYAAGGVGFGAAGLLIAPWLISTSPRLAFAAAAGVAVVAVVLAGVAEARNAGTQVSAVTREPAST